MNSLTETRWPQTATPGTTRDKVAQTIQIEGVPVHVVDTAGLRETADEVERLRTAPHIRPMADIRLAGTPAQVTETLQRIVRQGAHRLTVNFADAPRPDGTLLFSSSVLPCL